MNNQIFQTSNKSDQFAYQKIHFDHDESPRRVSSLSEKYQAFWNQINFIPNSRKTCDRMKLAAWGSDASVYRLTPKIIVDADNEDEMIALIKLAVSLSISVTFRAAGTSLSGQAVTDSVLIRLSANSYWQSYEINHQSNTITLRPGIIGAQANKYLAPFGKKIGPDPASINAAKIGGIVANNASGMCCGVSQNSYQTLVSMRVIFADGTLLDTGNKESIASFRQSHAIMLADISELANSVKTNSELSSQIIKKFQIKNTCGYALNAFTDYEDPLDILQHLMIGSEGTLGFIAEITLTTVPEYPYKASSLIFFDDIAKAAETVTLLKQCPVSAVELMDFASLMSVSDKPGMPNILQSLAPGSAALLVETRAENKLHLDEQTEQIIHSLAGSRSLQTIRFTDRPEEYQVFWNIRKGLFPSVGATRQIGTAVIIEDVAFEIQHLADATLNLQSLFLKHGYSDAIIFGHALEGNLHFVITEDFSSEVNVQRYHEFMDELCHLVVDKYNGSLKAEHGTGRNIAPFVELEWGAQAYTLMKSLKRIIDPKTILNPGVILNDDKNAHITSLKMMPSVHNMIDKCIECGFCEPVCPSRSLTLTPRQRIIALRTITQMNLEGNSDHAELKELEEKLSYQAIDTCAGDGMCATACPVKINTGEMMRTLRAEKLSSFNQKMARFIQRNYGGILATTRFGLTAAHTVHKILGTRIMTSVASFFHIVSKQKIPLWNKAMPLAVPAKKLKGLMHNSNLQADTLSSQHNDAGGNLLRVIYFPSCVSRTMRHETQSSLFEVMESLFRKASIEVSYPNNPLNLCCGMPFESKGAFDAAQQSLDELMSSVNYVKSKLAEQDDQNRSVVFVTDTSPCANHLTQKIQDNGIKIYDMTEFLHDFVLPRLEVQKVNETIVLHSTCSNNKMGLQDKLLSIAEQCASKVIVPDDILCCGWAGDKGFNVPQLNASALSNLSSQISDDCTSGYSTSTTCEIGLTLHSGINYQSIAYLLDRCSKGKN